MTPLKGDPDMMRTANPALNSSTFTGYGRAIASGDAMTIQGTANKTGLLLLLVLLSATWTWRLYYTAADSLTPWIIGGALGGFIVALITVFKTAWAPGPAALYALLEGVCNRQERLCRLRCLARFDAAVED